MELSAVQQCPQCGGECELSEASRLFVCSYCGVRLVRTNEVPRLLLPCKHQGEQLIWAPYLRLKGTIFTCHNKGLSHQVVDTTMAATQLNILAPSLGYRAQAMTLRHPARNEEGLFLNPTLSVDQALARQAKLARIRGGHDAQQEWIGETASLIYLPLTISNNTLHDGVNGDALAQLPEEGHDTFSSSQGQQGHDFSLTLLSSLCPSCGWDLECAEQSVILFCPNCATAWQSAEHGLEQVTYQVRPAKDNDSIHLPFWRHEMRISGVKLESYADFIRLTNIPKVIKPQWEEEKMAFYCPAFRLPPKAFIRLASQLTAAQLLLSSRQSEQLGWRRLTPATLPAGEAAEAGKVTLAASSVARDNILPLIKEIKLRPTSHTLVLLPFYDNGYELCQEEVAITINKKSLALGKKL
ncbi:MAG: hypothetical protein ABFR97_03410 [Thermodesulfobacteriota bacterium]